MPCQQSSRSLRSKDMNRVPPIDSCEHISEWCRRNSNHAVGWRGPHKPAALEALRVERHAEAVMPENLDQITSGAPEDVKIARMRISPQRFLHLQRQAIHTAPHIGSSDRPPDAYTRGYRDHRRSKISSTRRRTFSSKLPQTRTRDFPPTSISIVPTALDARAPA